MNYLLTATCLVAFLSAPQEGAAQDAVRFPALQADQLTPDQKKWADTITAPPRNGKFANPPYRAYIRSPELATRLTPLSDYLRWNTSLPARLSELAILITARHWTAQYEWYAHYPLAIKAGLDPGVAADIAAGKRPAGMKEDEAAVYDFCTELRRTRRVGDATYAGVQKLLGEQGVIDLIAVNGYYDMVSMTLNVAEVAAPIS